MNIKEKILEFQIDMITDKIDVFQDMINQLSLDAQNDAKSSAGDKHETGLSMMHLEQEKLSKIVSEAIEMKKFISKVDVSKKCDKIELGSFVRINAIYLFILASLPKLVIDGMSVISLSMDAPLAQVLLGKKLNDVVVFNGSTFVVNHLE